MLRSAIAVIDGDDGQGTSNGSQDRYSLFPQGARPLE
jgi:hypothetical protein